jgi:predicted Zn-dependent protease
MFKPYLKEGSDRSSTERLATGGYWPAQAALHLHNGEYAMAVSLCREQLDGSPELLSVRLVYARALQASGQGEAAAEQLYEILARDPDNLVALKCLADFHFENGDEGPAMLLYERIWTLDPLGHGLHCSIKRTRETTRTLTLTRASEGEDAEAPVPIIVSETIGDLYLSQGHNRMAAEVFRRLSLTNPHPRIKSKLSQALGKPGEKDANHVPETH